MTIDLRASVRNWFLENVPYDKSNAALVTELNSKDARELLIIYHNWMRRHVHAVPRKVFTSSALNANTELQKYKSALDAIIDDIESGRDITKYLSRRVKTIAEVSSKPNARRADLDLLLNDWNIHHLHLSTEVEQDGFVKRTGPLLFCVFKRGQAFLIDIVPHAQWTRRSVIEVIAREFPDRGIIHQIKGDERYKVVGLAVDYDENDHRDLRNAAINVLIQVDDKVFVPGGGMTTAGTTIEASRAADYLLSELELFERYVEERPDQLAALYRIKGVTPPSAPDYQFTFLAPSGFGVFETTTGTLFPLA